MGHLSVKFTESIGTKTSREEMAAKVKEVRRKQSERDGEFAPSLPAVCYNIGFCAMRFDWMNGV